MESDTVWECPANTDQVGGSLGLMARERAVRMRYDELSSMVLAETRIGSCAWEPSELICAGMLANSGFEANAVRFSTASIKGVVAIRHLLRLSSEKSPSRA